MGCTANVVIVTPEQIICGNLGDSRSILARINGDVLPLSIDHKPEDKEEIDRIHKAGGYVAEMRVCGNLNLSRCLGDFTYKLNSDLSYKE